MMVRHYFDTMFAPAKLSNRNPHTVYQYELNLKRFETFLGRPPLLADLNDENLGRCMAWLRTAHKPKPLSPVSIGKFRDNFCYLWKYLNARRVVDTLPTIDPPVEPVRIPRAWTKAELDALWDTLMRLPGEICGIPASLWFLTLHLGMWNTGERISAMLMTEWRDVDFGTRHVVIRAETRKGGREDNLGRFSPQTMAYLRMMLLPERRLIWPQPSRGWNIWGIEKRILKAAGLPYHGREFSFHTMRKSVASHVKAAGGNPQDALGHYDARLTQQIYVDPRIAPKQFASDVLFHPGSFKLPYEVQPEPKRIEQEEERHAG